MGTCLTSCLPHTDATRSIRNFNILDNGNNSVEFTFLVEDVSYVIIMVTVLFIYMIFRMYPEMKMKKSGMLQILCVKYCYVFASNNYAVKISIQKLHSILFLSCILELEVFLPEYLEREKIR